MKWYEGEISLHKKNLRDPKRRKGHERVKRLIEIAERAIALYEEVIRAYDQEIGLVGERIDIETQLEALGDT